MKGVNPTICVKITIMFCSDACMHAMHFATLKLNVVQISIDILLELDCM